MNSFLLSLPSAYYFKTRYNNLFLALIYIIKYFGFYFLIINSHLEINFNLIIQSLLIFLIFYNTYDFFCLLNDLDNPTIEYPANEIPLHRQIELSVQLNKFFCLKLINSLLLFLICYLVYPEILLNSFILFILVIFFFNVHNSISNTFKGMTLFILYLLKACILIIAVIDFLPNDVLYIYLAGSLLFNFSYVPKYVLNKTYCLKSKYPKLGNKPYLKAIVLKNVLISPLIFFNLVFFKILILINILTIIEYFYRKTDLTNARRN